MKIDRDFWTDPIHIKVQGLATDAALIIAFIWLVAVADLPIWANALAILLVTANIAYKVAGFFTWWSTESDGERTLEALKLSIEALQLYGDPSFYHGCLFIFSRPTGGFDEDLEEVLEYGRPMPGFHARETMKQVRAVLSDGSEENADSLFQDTVPLNDEGEPTTQGFVKHGV